jgi:hypothetical protein
MKESSRQNDGREGRKDWAPVANACNPSYSGGRDQKDRDSKPTPILKKHIKGLVEWLKV